VPRIAREPDRADPQPADPPSNSSGLADPSGATAPCSSFPPAAASSPIPPPGDVDLALYDALCDASCDALGSDPYAQYNALRRELDSFIQALEHRRRLAGLAK
jgi:hypothetical protein